MATRRMLSRRISLSKKFNKLSRCSQLLYLMQTPFLDDYGCYTADPEDIKAEVLPKNNMSLKEIKESLDEMNEIGIIKLYSIEEKTYQKYSGFEKFQSFRADRPRNHDYPEFKEDKIISGIPMTTNDIPCTTPSKDKLSKDKLREDNIIMSQDLRLATLLFDLIKENNPTHKQPNIESWAEEVRKMREIDKRTEQQIEFLMRWAQNDNFWRGNILSTKKLREKFDQLVMQCKNKIDNNKINIA